MNKSFIVSSEIALILVVFSSNKDSALTCDKTSFELFMLLSFTTISH